MKYSINYGVEGVERQERALLRFMNVEYILNWKTARGFKEDIGPRKMHNQVNLILKEIWIST